MKNGKKKIYELAEYFEMQDLLNIQYQNLSAGQKTRVNIVKSLLNDPELLLLDEPTASLDPDIADKTISFIEDLRSTKNISILYTSHDMEEVTRVCDEVIFINKGQIIAQDTPLALTKRIPFATVRLTFDAEKKLVENYLLEKNYTQVTFLRNNIVEIETREEEVPKIIFGLANEKIWLTDIEVKKPTLEDFFLNIARNTL
jgi:ABC-2 type transport system ATP-binding protein